MRICVHIEWASNGRPGNGIERSVVIGVAGTAKLEIGCISACRCNCMCEQPCVDMRPIPRKTLGTRLWLIYKRTPRYGLAVFFLPSGPQESMWNLRRYTRRLAKRDGSDAEITYSMPVKPARLFI